jgi:hypothetical protein
MPFGIKAILSSAAATGGSSRSWRSSLWHPATDTDAMLKNARNVRMVRRH